MGLDLFDKTVESTYDGLLKTSDNDNITGIAKQITDGNGNNTPLWISTTRIGVGLAPAVGYDFTTNLGKFTTIDATTVNASFVGDLTGNADTATKWATARTITLSGDVSGSTSIDGSLNVSINAVVANDSHTHDTRYYTETEIDATLTNYQLLSEKGAALGYAPLDSGGKVAEAYLPDSIVGQVEYQGTWDASLNTPTLSTLTTPKGHYYIVSVGGTFDSITYAVGDWIISDGTSWNKVDNTDAVTTFNGRLGSIVPLEADYSSFYVLKSGDTMTGNLTAPTFIGALSGNATTATTWQTARTLTIGDTGKTVDGSANVSWSRTEIGITKTNIDALNINADTLDSLNSAQFLRSDVNDTMTADLTLSKAGSAIFRLTNTTAIQSWITYVASNSDLVFRNETDAITAMFFDSLGNATITGVVAASGGNSTNWNTAYSWGDWSTGVTKSFVDALGVNADTLDSLNATDFLRANAADTATGNLTFSGTNTFSGDAIFNNDVTLTHSATGRTVDGITITNSDTANTGVLTVEASNKLTWNGDALLTVTLANYVPLSGGTMTGDLHIEDDAPILHLKDTNSTGSSASTTQIRLYDQLNTRLGDIGYGVVAAAPEFYIDSKGNGIKLIGNTTISGTLSATGYNNTNWDTAYGWGNHASAGYLTSYTETDPIYTASSWYTTTNNSANWNTAYGWGDWSTGVTKTFVDALNVDADTLDSLNSTQFLRSDVNTTLTGDLTISKAGSAVFRMTNTTAVQSWIAYVGSGDEWIFRDETDARTAMILKGTGDVEFSGGNVSIGGSTASYKVDVTGDIRATGDILAYSDIRVKENIYTIENALDITKKMRGVFYNKIGESTQRVGVIAQETEKVLPQAVSEDADGMKSVAYGNIIGLHTEAIKELALEKDIDIAKKDEQIAELNLKIANLQTQIDELKSR